MKTIDTERGNGTDGVPSRPDTPGQHGAMGPLDGSAAASDHLDHAAKTSQQLARISGFLYLIIAAFGMFAGSVSTGLVVAGDSGATAGKVLASAPLVRGSLAAWTLVLLADVAVAVTLYALLRPAGATLSILAATFRVAYAAIQAVSLLTLFNALFLLTDPAYAAGLGQGQVQALALLSLEQFGTGFKLGLIFFGAHLIFLGYLLSSSRYVPRAVGMLVVAAGIGYFADNLASFFAPGYGGIARAIPMVPAVVGELALTFWLLIKGVSEEAVTRASTSALPTSANAQSARLAREAGGVS